MNKCDICNAPAKLRETLAGLNSCDECFIEISPLHVSQEDKDFKRYVDDLRKIDDSSFTGITNIKL